MSVIDLRGDSPGDAAGLAALAAVLRTAAGALRAAGAAPEDVALPRAAALACDDAAAALRSGGPAAAGAEARLAVALRTLLPGGATAAGR